MTQRFKDKVAVITGGNSGIGLAAAKAFAREGAKVAITGRSEDTLRAAEKEIGAGTLALQADLSKLAGIAAFRDRVRETFGRIDALFVNHGVAIPGAFESVSEAHFDEMVDTNVKGAFFTIQKTLPLLTRDSAVILNASINAHRANSAGAVYALTKAAIVNLGKSLASDLAPRGIRVNVISPGPVETPIFGRMGFPEEQMRQMKEQVAGLVPLKRFARPDEIAAAVLFLASSESSYVVGSELIVDGGMMRT
ncbi:MAG TPA: SDR family oxidoreductase [Candidatus Polarisedimenticolia bacterium]|nr:SDR family oxidoreductase [Candidatus Polarisedimenticolia bacterium]